MKKHIIVKSWLLCITFVLFSCSTDKNELPENVQSIPDEVIKKVESLSLNPDGMTMETFETPDGAIESVYMIEGDIAIYPEQLENMVANSGTGSEQYSTRDLVTQPRTISVIGYTGGENALTTSMRNGTILAINNYNALNLTLTFTLTFATSVDADIVVFRDPNITALGGSAGFPSNGNPFKWTRLFAGMDNVRNDVNEHVVTHEIGHSIGLRHTDWFNRFSCGQNESESTSQGAHHIPGTPTGYDPTSIMLACFSLSTSGEFNDNDITALQFLY